MRVGHLVVSFFIVSVLSIISVYAPAGLLHAEIPHPTHQITIHHEPGREPFHETHPSHLPPPMHPYPGMMKKKSGKGKYIVGAAGLMIGIPMAVGLYHSVKGSGSSNSDNSSQDQYYDQSQYYGSAAQGYPSYPTYNMYPNTLVANNGMPSYGQMLPMGPAGGSAGFPGGTPPASGSGRKR